MAHTLLLADDSVTIQRVIELTFADEDVHVVAVSDGDEAIAVLDKTPPDIVLADVGMPGRNGYEVAQHIKDTPRLAHIPVVLLTGAFEPIDQAKAAAAGCDGVLAKPFEPQLVIGRVKELLAKPKATPTSVAPPPPVPAVPWSAPIVSPPAPRAQAATKAGDAGEYFDRLDQAFASLATGQAASAKSDAASPAVADSIDWFAPQPPAPSERALVDRWDVRPPAPPSDLPLAYVAPVPAAVASPPPFDPSMSSGWVAPGAGRAWPADVAAIPPPVLPPLADAFAALLAAEQSAPAPIAAPAWPGAAAAPVSVSEDVIEQVTRRVLDQLTDRVVRETVAEKVSAVAERLVREEIARIKASIK